MSQIQEDLVIVLRVVPFEDRHRIVTGLSEKHGRVSAMARNAINSRRFGGCLEPFVASLWRYSEREGANLRRLDETVIRRDFAGLRKSFEILSLASVFNEMMLRLAPENEPALDLFKLHSNALAVLEEFAQTVTPDLRVLLGLLNSYLAKVLQWNGTQPQLLRCIGCEKSLLDFAPETRLRTHISTACWSCPSCRDVRPDSAEDYAPGFQHRFLEASQIAVGDFYLALTTPMRKIPETLAGNETAQRELFRLLESLLIYHVPGFDRRGLHALRFLGIAGTVDSPGSP